MREMPLYIGRSVARSIRLGVVLLGAFGLGQALGAELAEKPAGDAKTFHVSETFNQSPFDYRAKLLRRQTGYRVIQLTFPSPMETEAAKNNTVTASLYLPDAASSRKTPAVLCLSGLDGSLKFPTLECEALAGRGLAAVTFSLPHFNERATGETDAVVNSPTAFLQLVLQSIADIRRTVDLLASRPEIDAECIDITGMSLGALITATAAGKEPRLHRACLFLGGGNLLKIVHHAAYTSKLSQAIKSQPQAVQEALQEQLQAVEPLAAAPALRARASSGQVLMINAAQDEIIPREATLELANALGIAPKIVWMPGMHCTVDTSQVIGKIVGFFAQDLSEGTVSGPARTDPHQTGLQRLAAFLKQALILFAKEPEAGRCHAMDLAIVLKPTGMHATEMSLQLVRGRESKFALKTKAPILGDIAAGQGQSPWMLTGSGKNVLLGAQNPIEDRNPLGFADPLHVAKVRAIGGLLSSLLVMPNALTQWVVVSEKKIGDDLCAVHITAKQKDLGNIVLTFQNNKKTPSEIVFDVAGVAGKIAVRGWQVNAAADDSLFEPPADLHVRKVDQAELYHTFSSLFNFVMDRME